MFVCSSSTHLICSQYAPLLNGETTTTKISIYVIISTKQKNALVVKLHPFAFNGLGPFSFMMSVTTVTIGKMFSIEL